MELQHKHRTSVLSNPTTDVRGRRQNESEWGEKKKRKKGVYFFKGVRHCFRGFPVCSEIHQAVNGPKVRRTISCNIHQRRGIMYVCMPQRKQDCRKAKKICIANVLEMVKVEELQQRKDEKWESRSDCVLPSLLLYIKLPGEDTICYHNMYDLLMCPMKTPVVGTDTLFKMRPADWKDSKKAFWECHWVSGWRVKKKKRALIGGCGAY